MLSNLFMNINIVLVTLYSLRSMVIYSFSNLGNETQKTLNQAGKGVHLDNANVPSHPIALSDKK